MKLLKRRSCFGIIGLMMAFIMNLPIAATAYRPFSPQEELDKAYMMQDIFQLLPWWWAGNPDPITVPDDYATIQGAIDNAAYFNQRIQVRPGVYAEALSIDADDFINLSIEGMCGELPVIQAPSTGTLISIFNTNDQPFKITIRNFHLNGLVGGARADEGIKVFPSTTPMEEVTTTLDLSNIFIEGFWEGVEVGIRPGEYSCGGDWGSINVDILHNQPLTEVTIDRCTVLDCLEDGMNLWRAQGSILSTIVGPVGGEGIHTSHFDGVVRNCIFIGQDNNQFHLHYPRDVQFFNNFVGAGVASPGDGLVVAGIDLHDDPTNIVNVRNNVFAGNDGAGVRIVRINIVDETSGCDEVQETTKTQVRNNLFFDNASNPGRNALFQNSATANSLTNYASYNLFYQNHQPEHVNGFVDLGAGNIFDSDPQLLSYLEDDDDVLEALFDVELIRGKVMGIQPNTSSPLVDGGTPSPANNDVSSYTVAGSRCDIGLFGGPAASPAPTMAGAKPVRCPYTIVDWFNQRIFIRLPLQLEPYTDPTLAVATYSDSTGSFTVKWANNGIVPVSWFQNSPDVTMHTIGEQAIKLYRTPEERRELSPITTRREYEVKQPEYEIDDPYSQP